MIICLVVVPRLDWNAVVDLQAKRLWGVIYDDSFLQITPKHGQIFHKVPIDLNARISKKAMLEPLLFGIEHVQ
jgi:hypothetical protein